MRCYAAWAWAWAQVWWYIWTGVTLEGIGGALGKMTGRCNTCTEDAAAPDPRGSSVELVGYMNTSKRHHDTPYLLSYIAVTDLCLAM